MSSVLKPIPCFASEAEERRFWEAHDSTLYVVWTKSAPARFPNLRRSARAEARDVRASVERAARDDA
jgi:hypothetical protein